MRYLFLMSCLLITAFCDDDYNGEEIVESFVGLDDNYVTVTVIVPGRKTNCYYYQAEGDFEVDYQVVKGGDMEIDMIMKSPHGEVIREEIRKRDSAFDVEVPRESPNKAYEICFNNDFSGDEKRVFLEIDINYDKRREILKSQRLDHLPKDLSMDVTLESFYNSVELVDMKLRTMSHHQSKFRNTELIDRSIMEDNFTRVNWWSAFQLIVMISVGCLQVFLIRSLFDEKNPFHKFFSSKRY